MTTTKTETLTVTVNGEATVVPAGATVGDLVAGRRAGPPRGVAVACNGAVVPRSSWAVTPLAGGDSVELLVAVAGG